MFAAIEIGHDDAVADDADGWVGAHGLHHASQFVARPPIIAIEERDDFAASLGNSSVERGGLAAIRFAQQAHARFEFAHNFWSAIGRAVIHHQNFHVTCGKILFQHAHDRFFDEAFVIVRVN